MLFSASPLFLQPPIRSHSHHPPRNKLPTGHKRPLRRILDPAAAGHFHAYNGQTLDVIPRNDRRQLLGIIALVQLGAPDQRDAVPDKLLMEVGIRIRRAIGGDLKSYCTLA